jgi:dihydrofolate reductase
MRIVTRFATSADGYVTTPDGWPAHTADPAFGSGNSYGFPEFQKTLDAVLMGRTTFEPAIGASRWPWPDLDVFVLGSHRPEGTPEDVVVDSDPKALLEQLRAANSGGDVHLVGGPRTIETYRALGAVDRLGLLVVPILLGGGMRLTDAVDPGAGLALESSRELPRGSVELVYTFT